MGRTTSKGNEVKLKMKHPSNMPMPRFEHGDSDLWSNTIPLDHGDALHNIAFILADGHRVYLFLYLLLQIEYMPIVNYLLL